MVTMTQNIDLESKVSKLQPVRVAAGRGVVVEGLAAVAQEAREDRDLVERGEVVVEGLDDVPEAAPVVEFK